MIGRVKKIGKMNENFEKDRWYFLLQFMENRGYPCRLLEVEKEKMKDFLQKYKM